MNWRDWPTWLKGGVIVLVFELTLILLMYPFFKFGFLNVPNYIQPVIIVLSLPLVLSFFIASYIFSLMNCRLCIAKGTVENFDCFNPSYCDLIPMFVIIITAPIFSFLLGAFIGWIVGKFKKK